jgi:Uma2 family endonuclease
MGEAGMFAPDVSVELIWGKILKMSPIHSEHASVVNVIARRLILALEEGAYVSVQNPLYIDDFSEPQPDILVACPRPDDYRNAHPRPDEVLLLIEVADSSVRFDRTVKLPLYARAGIPEYWLVNLHGKQVEQYLLEEGQRAYAPGICCQIGDILRATRLPFHVAVRDIFGKGA